MAEAYIILPDDSGNAGKKVRAQSNTVSAQTVYSQSSTLVDSSGNLLEGQTQALPVKNGQPAATTGSLTAANAVITGSMAAGSTVSATVTNYAAAVVAITGTYIGTVAFDGSNDSATTFDILRGKRLKDGLNQISSGSLTNTTRYWLVSTAGLTTLRIRASAYTSGTIAVTVTPVAVPVPSDGTVQVSKIKLRNLAGTATAISTVPGVLYGLLVTNAQAAITYVQVFDLATGDVTPGTTTPDLERAIPASVSAAFEIPAQGVPFGTAISAIAATAEGGGTGSNSGVQVFAIYA